MTDAPLPAGLIAGRRTPTFDQASTPSGLRAAHHTAVWAELVVEAGTVRFVDEATGDGTVIAAGHRRVIVPHVHHHVEPDADARFHVQFWIDP